MPLLKVSVTRKSDGVSVISSSGSIDSDTYLILQKKVDEVMSQSPRVIVFDMKEVSYISSMGIKVILRAREMVEGGGGIMLMTDLQPQIAKVFDIVKAIPTQNIFSGIEEMDRYLASIQRKEIDKRKTG